jgi:hypothetical protein
MITKDTSLTVVREKIEALFDSRVQGTFTREELVRYVELVDLERALLR